MTLVYSKQGFTLIELLVVMAISGVLMAFVGPVALEQVDASQAKSEIEKLKAVIRTASIKSYSKGEAITINLEASSIKNIKKDNKKVTFKHLSFPHQIIFFNRNGYSNQVEVSYRYKGQLIRLDIYSILGYQEGEFTYAP